MLSTVALLFSLAATFLSVFYGIEFAVGASANQVLAWWWSHGEGQAAVLSFSFGLLVFSFVFSLWAMSWLQILWGRPAQYVWLGPALRNNKDYYFALDDPAKKRLVVQSRTAQYGNSSGSAVDILFTIHTMLRYGPHAEQAEKLANHNTRSQIVLVLFQYLALAFGLIAVGQVLYQYAEQQGHGLTASLLSVTGSVVITPLVVLHFLGLVSGHLVLRRKSTSLKIAGHTKARNLDLKPGDRISVTLMENARERDSSGNKPFKSFYRVEWPVEHGLAASAVIAFRATWKLRSEIEELDRMTKRRRKIDCLVADDYRLHPLLLSNAKSVDWI
ncbi:hypothetical protein [Pelagibius sp. Alg239-R121]|uniref:hypothetical protein n=1 Tax=Pelagibius sp. Alg239-R121 TaxID=2993448 RepID=UPI0024A653D8|nr:hypothetical protein [Pelagibius sp. Alg239-R121]